MTEDSDEESQIHEQKKRLETNDSTCHREPSTPIEISAERLTFFRRKVSQAFIDSRQQQISVKRLTKLVNAMDKERFSENEIVAALNEMSEANQIMVSEGFVFLIWILECIKFGASDM